MAISGSNGNQFGGGTRTGSDVRNHLAASLAPHKSAFVGLKVEVHLKVPKVPSLNQVPATPPGGEPVIEPHLFVRFSRFLRTRQISCPCATYATWYRLVDGIKHRRRVCLKSRSGNGPILRMSNVSNPIPIVGSHRAGNPGANKPLLV